MVTQSLSKLRSPVDFFRRRALVNGSLGNLESNGLLGYGGAFLRVRLALICGFTALRTLPIYHGDSTAHAEHALMVAQPSVIHIQRIE
jgi:hypothetical protein